MELTTKARPIDPERASKPVLTRRLAWGGIAAAAVTVLAVAAWLEPSASGHGTHTQLGLPPCGFLTLTGFPCPGCGLTTAFAHGVRGSLVQSAIANPLGLAMFLLTCLAVPVGFLGAVRGWSFERIADRVSLHQWALVLAGAAVLVWTARFVAAL